MLYLRCDSYWHLFAWMDDRNDFLKLVFLQRETTMPKPLPHHQLKTTITVSQPKRRFAISNWESDHVLVFQATPPPPPPPTTTPTRTSSRPSSRRSAPPRTRPRPWILRWPRRWPWARAETPGVRALNTIRPKWPLRILSRAATKCFRTRTRILGAPKVSARPGWRLRIRRIHFCDRRTDYYWLLLLNCYLLLSLRFEHF